MFLFVRRTPGCFASICVYIYILRSILRVYIFLYNTSVQSVFRLVLIQLLCNKDDYVSGGREVVSVLVHDKFHPGPILCCPVLSR